MLISLVPPLPELSDPDLFIQVHDAFVDPSDDVTTKPTHKKLRQRFAALCKQGDALLLSNCLRIIYDYFGEDDGKLTGWIIDATKSNETMRHFAIAYKIDQCIQIDVSDRDKTSDKIFADIWEAYWGALFTERRLWNDGDADLVSCLRVLVYLQHETLINDLGIPCFFTSEPTLDIRSFVPANDIDVIDLETHPGLKIPPHHTDGVGYTARVKPTSEHYSPVSIFSSEKAVAISQLHRYCSVSWSTCLFPRVDP